MMVANPRGFDKLRIVAAGMFAQTMIFVDDQASQDIPEEASHGNLRAPGSGIRAKLMPDNELKEQDNARDWDGCAFNAKSLIDSAMNQGLICSVLRPEKDEKFQNRVVTAAQVADIVCLDWEIYSDSGAAALKIICDILQRDADQGGRLRLIAIYTGDVASKDKIMNKVLEAVPERIRKEQKFNITTTFEIKNKSGVRIVCLFKKHGVKLDDSISGSQVTESELPQRLQSEFAKLSEGLLSNVALATIASIRNSTHHVLSKFVGQMDGPFFHHRAMIENPEDAEEYAVNIVLSELKGAVDKQQIGAAHAGHQAIGDRIRELAEDLGNPETLTLHYEKEAKPITCELEIDHAVKMVSNGLSCTLEDSDGEMPANPPGKKVFEKSLSSLFSDSLKTARSHMHQFAALTGVQARPRSYLCRPGAWFPKLGLGTIIQGKDKTYLMCLQASCDSVRIKKEESFLFVGLDKKDTDPEHVVPILPDNAREFEYVGLSTSSESYRAIRTIKFSASQDTKTVNAEKNEKQSSFYFKDADGNNYLWIADLKRRRASRTVQRLGQDMGRLGFDEFEPYRQN